MAAYQNQHLNTIAACEGMHDVPNTVPVWDAFNKVVYSATAPSSKVKGKQSLGYGYVYLGQVITRNNRGVFSRSGC